MASARVDPLPRWDPIRLRWQLNAQKDGKRRAFYSPKLGKAGSAEVKRKRRAWLDGQSLDEVRLEKLFAMYLEDIKAKHKSTSHYSQNEKFGRLYLIPRLGHKKVRSITDQEWQDCITQIKKPLSKHTLMDIRGVITSFCRYAKRSRLIDAVPEQLEIPKDAPIIGKRALQPSQVKMLFEQSDEWYINAWRLMAVTGLRPGEVYGLKPGDIKNGFLTISRSVSEDRIVTQGKNKNAHRVMKIHAIAQEIISEQQMSTMHLHSPWTFCAPDGDVTHPKVAYEHWRRWARPLGILASPYALRHTFVSLTKNELPAELLKQLVGHSESMDTFGVYGHVMDGEMDRAATVLDEVFRNTLK